MLVGCDPLLAVLQQTLEDAAAGRGGAVLVDGEAGLGKSALLSEADRSARHLGMQVRSACAGELEQDLPWGVVRALLRRPARAQAAVPPILRAVLGLAGDTPEDDLVPLLPLADLVAELADVRPLLLLVDDAHWADTESARWLAYLTGHLPDLPVALVVAARPTDPRRPPALTALAGRNGVQVLRLAPLDDDGVRAVVRHALPDADDELCLACSQATGGNQFLTVELVRELTAADDPAPALVQELDIAQVGRVLARRLQAAGADAAKLARAIAVLGAATDSYQAATFSQLRPEAAWRAADALRAAGLLAAERDDRLSFAHPLFRVAMARSIPPGERAIAHLAAARHFDATGDVERVGAHLLVVEPGGDPWVRQRLIAAAEAAWTAGSTRTAKALLERALAERSQESAPALLRQLGRTALAVDPPAAVEPLRTALSLLEEPAERVACALDLTAALQGSLRLAETVPLLEALAGELEATEPQLWLRVEAELLSQSCLQPDQLPARHERLGRVAARLTGEHDEEALVVLQLAVDQTARGRADRARELAEAAWGDGRLWTLVDRRSSPVAMWVLYVLMYADAPERAVEIGEQWLRDLRGRTGGTDAVFALSALSEAQWRVGDLYAAETSASTAWRGARELGPSFTGWWIVIATLAQALTTRGGAPTARTLLTDAGLMDGPPLRVWSMPSVGIVRALVLIETGDVERGVGELLTLHRWLRAVDPSPGAWWYPSELAAGLTRLGRRSEALAIVECWLEEATEFGSATVSGMARRTRGLLCADVDELEEAERLLSRSTARAQHACALLELGAAHRRSNRRADARPLLARALELAGRCGAEGLAGRARVELGAAGGRPRAARSSGVDSLTASERRVAQLAGQGLSNPEIAQSLYVTRKTVEKHLAGAYAKLGISSRHALAGLLPTTVP